MDTIHEDGVEIIKNTESIRKLRSVCPLSGRKLCSTVFCGWKLYSRSLPIWKFRQASKPIGTALSVKKAGLWLFFNTFVAVVVPLVLQIRWGPLPGTPDPVCDYCGYDEEAYHASDDYASDLSFAKRVRM